MLKLSKVKYLLRNIHKSYRHEKVQSKLVEEVGNEISGRYVGDEGDAQAGCVGGTRFILNVSRVHSN